MTTDHVCDSGNFDRSLCPEPCGAMHSYCDRCGERQDRCAHEPVGKAEEATRMLEWIEVTDVTGMTYRSAEVEWTDEERDGVRDLLEEVGDLTTFRLDMADGHSARYWNAKHIVSVAMCNRPAVTWTT